jgi:hypothetical protein
MTTNETVTENKMSKAQYQRLVMKKVEDNHIWLNKATYYFSPTDEQKIALANMILEKLKEKSTQIPARGITDDCKGIRELAELTPILYLSINWS